MRNYHRYLGHFLIGIMFVYALSGVLLIFRNTDFLKSDREFEKQLEPDIALDELGKSLHIKNLEIIGQEGDIVSFKNGSFNTKTGLANYTVRDLPTVLKKLTDLHKANTDRPLFWLNILFGCSLLFFVISSMWMYIPREKNRRNGIIITLVGIVLTIALLFL